MTSLTEEVDISVLCEEVVEGVYAGHAFREVDIRGMTSGAGSIHYPAENSMGPEQLQYSEEVPVILDIDCGNYRFTTQPGAFRRVIMNLLGNALKYTSRGHIRIKLEAVEMEDMQTPRSEEPAPRSLVTLTVTDTGRGISSEFLQSKLFMPFAQEDSLSSGIGLGLSIVRSLVALLGGDITIDSKLGFGTRKSLVFVATLTSHSAD
jgi:signal transduction histidine kinase